MIELVIGVLRQVRWFTLATWLSPARELNDLLGVLDMAVNAQRQRLGALEQDPGVEWIDVKRPRHAKQDSADIGCEGGGTGSLGKRDTVVGGVASAIWAYFPARLPVEVTAVDDHTAQRGAVAADELGCRVDDDVGTMLQRTEQIRVPKVLSTTTGRPCFWRSRRWRRCWGCRSWGYRARLEVK